MFTSKFNVFLRMLLMRRCYHLHKALPTFPVQGCNKILIIGVARRGQRRPWLQNILTRLVILCFEKRCPKQNTVARLKSKDFPPQNFGLATPLILIYFCDARLASFYYIKTKKNNEKKFASTNCN